VRRRHLLLLSALGVGVVLGTAHLSAVQEPHLEIEAHGITEKLHMLVSDVDIIITGHWDTLLAWSDLVEYRGFYTDLYDQTY